MDSREKIIKQFIQNKSVLDLGVGDNSDRFLHRFIKQNSRSCIGVELDAKRAKALIKQGYDIKIANAENIHLNEQFDVIIAGDLIEHLNNPGLFLEAVKKHMRDDSVFICNTPNIYSINFILRGLFFGGNVKQFKEHSLGFNEDLIKELFGRYEFNIEKIIYFSHKEPTLTSKVIRLFSSLSKKWHENILIIAKKNGKIKQKKLLE